MYIMDRKSQTETFLLNSADKGDSLEGSEQGNDRLEQSFGKINWQWCVAEIEMERVAV